MGVNSKMKQTLLNIFTLFQLLLRIFLIKAEKVEVRGNVLSLEKLNPCERAVWSCCQSDGRGKNQKLPTFCFEQNGCHGLWWLGQEACSELIVNTVAAVLNPENPFTLSENQKRRLQRLQAI